ncbi:MAG: ATP phosphoribosyltransferase regulatory subunit [Alphaproteobacteria bacterium BRH_c36]|nr:MAG: ATP phosphoribosyltransferase regulatory subunit [Alphaproteobacteria bacterium BRH_c36]
MVAETAREFEALEEQARKLLSAFVAAGHEAVAPAVLQPADVYLDVIGEALRARSYVFTDPDGDEFCLRPDLTVPICRLHLERHPEGSDKASYCYNGSAFRFQPRGADAAHPREFRQCGIESIGAGDRENTDAHTLALILKGLEESGLKEWKLRIGDLGLFRALLSAIDMPERWRERLRHQFWRPLAFREELERLTKPVERHAVGIPEELLEGLDPARSSESARKVARYLDDHGIELQGVRTLEEISLQLARIAADRRAERLPVETANLIEGYIGVRAPARAAGARVKDLIRDVGIDITPALDAYHRRLQLLSELGVDVAKAEFSAEFGRSLEYYTGFVFEVQVPDLGEGSPVAGGGRYDGLMKMCGAPAKVAAVGGAIHTERLLKAVRG